MKETYFVTKSKEENSLWLFTEPDFKRFGDQLMKAPTADNRTATMLVMYFMRTAASVDVDISNMSDVLNSVREIPSLWDYLTDGKEEGIQVFRLEQEQVEGRSYNPWVLSYVTEK